MADNKLVSSYVLRGALFQFPMIILWGFRAKEAMPYDFHWNPIYFPDTPLNAGIILMFSGLGIMAVAMGRIYWRRTKHLIVTDMFAMTRHPMYHGMFIADLALFFIANLHDPLWWLSSILFWVLLCAAGWFQEKETLARYGDDAKRYYDRTPRFIFEWLWFRRSPVT